MPRGGPYDAVVPDKEADARLCRAFGVWVRELRERRKLTQADVAARVGITPSYLWQIETGKRNPTLAVVVRLARALDLKPGRLVARLDEVE
jgi:transcriptional regulator with XRE-family HTH domain